MAGLYELWPYPANDKDNPARWKWTMTVLSTVVILRRPADMADDLRFCLLEVVGRQSQ